MKMFVKGISTEDFLKNCLKGTSNRSLRMRTMTVSKSYPAIRLEGSPILLQKFGSEFSRTKSFCFENGIYLLAFGLGICEGVSEESGHGIGHVDIRVGS